MNQYKSSLKMVEVEEVVELVFYRPLAFIFVRLIQHTGITPNHITLVGLITGVAGGIALSFSHEGFMILAAVLLILFNLLDCSDGQLARLRGTSTPMGRILDGISDYLVSTAVYIGLGIGFASHSAFPYFYWGLLVCTATSNIFHSVLVDYYRKCFLAQLQNRENNGRSEKEHTEKEFNEIESQKGKWFQKLIISIYFKYSTLQTYLTSRNAEQQHVQVNDQIRHNKVLMHLWTYLGPASQWSFLIVCIFINRIDIYLWGMCTVLNAYALVLLIVQKRMYRKKRNQTLPSSSTL